MNKTNFDKYLEKQMKETAFAAQFWKAEAAWQHLLKDEASKEGAKKTLARSFNATKKR